VTDAWQATNLVAWATAQRDMIDHIGTLTRHAQEAKTIVEFGTRGGVSTWAFLDGLPADGWLWSVDIDDCMVPARVSEDSRWTFIQGDDTSLAVLDQLPEQADLVFIDTSHTYAHTVMELDFAVTLHPSRILLHDADWPGVERAIKQFCPKYGWEMVAFDEAHDDAGPYSLATLEPV
jgi:predicted O-methyltransferase YrrM